MLKTIESLGLSVAIWHQLLLTLHFTPFNAWERIISRWVGDRLSPKTIWIE
jgi:hypothetical protein